MKTKRFFGVMALTVILAMFTVLSLTACGFDDSTGGGNGGDTQTTGDKTGDGPILTVGPNGYTDKQLINTIAFGNGKFVTKFSLGNSSKMTTSIDGITWTAGTECGIIAPHVIAYCNDKFIVGGFRNITSYSTDGITWKTKNFLEQPVDTYPVGEVGNFINTIAYGNGIFVAGANEGEYSIYIN
jgi:hypothetical protein